MQSTQRHSILAAAYLSGGTNGAEQRHRSAGDSSRVARAGSARRLVRGLSGAADRRGFRELAEQLEAEAAALEETKRRAMVAETITD
jgi:hypothetical protein